MQASQHTDAASALPRTRAAARPFVRIEVIGDLPEAAAAWRILVGRASPYQSLAWVQAWCQTIGEAVKPAIAIAYGENSDPVALLPFGLSRQSGATVLGFLGGKDSNCNVGLFRPGVTWSADDMRALLRAAARIAGADLLVLRNQPALWAGAPNPLLVAGAQPSPSACWGTRLDAEPEAFLQARLSKHARKHLRQKQAKLAALGALRFWQAGTDAEVKSVTAAYLAQKAARFVALGIDPGDEDKLGRFLEKAADPLRPALELHALSCGDTIVATFGAAVQADHASGMIVSFDARPDVARCSPGDLLLAHVVATFCRRRLKGFDLGIGEARYKEAFCPEPMALFDTLLGTSLRGRVTAGVFALALRGKRGLKQSRWWPFLLRARARFGHRARPSPARAGEG